MATQETSNNQNTPKAIRCVASPNGVAGYWEAGSIRRANEDGTYNVNFDTMLNPVMPLQVWFGITAAEISFNDEEQWNHVFSQLASKRRGFLASRNRGFKLSDFEFALAVTGLPFQQQGIEMWTSSCVRLFGIRESCAGKTTLDSDSAYRLFRSLGMSARYILDCLEQHQRQSYYKLYFNQIRMGGRDPSEIGRLVTLDDAFAAMGVAAGDMDSGRMEFVEPFEKSQNVKLPTTLKEFTCHRTCTDGIRRCHPNTPHLLDPRFDMWEFRRGMREHGLNGDCAIVMMLPDQGLIEWLAVFDDGERDARVYVSWESEEGTIWHMQSPTIGMFFWDLVQTGLAWYQDPFYRKDRYVKRTDIGLMLDT